MKNLICCFVLFLSIPSFSQPISSGPLNHKQVVDSNRLNDIWELRFSKQDAIKVEINGSLYLFDTWDNLGSIEYDNKKYILKDVNYNILLDQFEYKISSDSVFVFDNNIDLVHLANKKFKKYYLDVNLGRKYCEVVFEGINYSLIKKYDVRLREAGPNPLMLKDQGNKFITSKKYYIKNNVTNSLFSIKFKKKNIVSLFPDKENDIKSYIKKNKFSFKKENDLVKIFKYYDSL